MPPKTPPHDNPHRRTLAAYYATLLALFAASIFPEFRLWGAGGWPCLSLTARLIIFALTSAAPWLLWRLASRPESDQALSPRIGALLSLCIIAASIAVYLLLNARTHFLGDGYTVLANLAADNPILKPRELGAELVNHLIKSIIGGGGEAAALLTYQIVSVGAGLLSLIVIAWFAGKLYEHRRDRLLFQLLLTLCGSSLLFFGYVENYALFGLSVTLFTLTGLLVAQQAVNRFWLLLPLGLALFFHILGVDLIPAALYLLLRDTALARRLTALSSGNRSLLIAALLIACAVGFGVLYQRDYFVRFAIVPLMPNRFSVPGYTLFAPRHLADWLNLLCLLVPGIAVLLTTIAGSRWKPLLRQPPIRFAFILSITALLAVFVLDPKLGMARDWDLFSLPAIPLTALLLVVALGLQSKRRSATLPLLLSAVLAAAVLLPRAVVLHSPSLGVDQAQNLMTMDAPRNRSGINVLAKYLHQVGDTARYNALETFWRERYPEQQLTSLASGMISAGKYAEARTALERALSHDPQYSEAWNGLGRCYLIAGQPDSSLEAIRIADGLNPYSPVVLSDLGAAYIDLGRWDDAEDAYRRSSQLDSTSCVPLICLAFLRLRKGDLVQYEAYLNRGLSRTDATAANLQGLGKYFLLQRDIKMATVMYRNALARGLDSAVVRDLVGRYPDLARIL